MNVLGKIFVIANLIFSVATAALIVVVYATRTNWQARAAEMEGQAKTANANAYTYWELVNTTRKEEKKKQDELANNLTAATVALKDEMEKSARLDKNLADEKAKYSKLLDENKLIAEVNNRLQEENKLVKDQVNDTNKRLVTMEEDKAKLRTRAVGAEIASASQQERNDLLLEDNERLTRELQKSKAVAATGGQPAAGPLAKNPPLEDLEGVVEASDAQGWVTITLGSNHNIQKNQTLEVFRLTPEGKYLGTIRIFDVRADKSVGKPVSRPVSPIQVGDRVASRILGG